MRGTEADGDARHATDRLNDAHELRRTKCAAIDLKAWREIGDAHRATILVDQFGRHDRSISNVFGTGVDLSVEHHIGEALVLIAGEQSAKNRIPVVTRQAPPHDT